jgi:hypothetical protein
MAESIETIRIKDLPLKTLTSGSKFVADDDGGPGAASLADIEAAIAAAFSADPATYKVAGLDATLKIPSSLLPPSVSGALSYLGSIAGVSVPNSAAAPGNFYIISSAGTSQGKTWAQGDQAIYRGPSGTWDQVAAGVPQIGGGGTGATTAAQARANLSLLSQQETDARVHAYLPGMKWNGPAGGERVVSQLTGQNIGTNGYALRLVVSLPATIQSTDGLAHISSSSSSSQVVTGCLWVLCDSTGFLHFRLFGSGTGTDYRQKSLAITWGDKVVELMFVRSGNTATVYVNGTAVTTTEETSGTPPNWSDSMTSTFFHVGSANNASEAVYFAASVFNFAPTAADVSEVYFHGIRTKWRWGSQTELIAATGDRDFSNAVNWSNTSIATFDKVTDLSISSTANGQVCRLDGVAFGGTSAFKAYEISFDAANASGAAFTIRFESQGAFVPVSNGATIVNGRNAFNAIAQGNSGTGGIEIVASGTGSADLDNFNLRRVGAIVDLDLTIGVGFQCPDRSSNKLHGDITATTIEHRIARYEAPLYSRAMSSSVFGRFTLLAVNDLPARAIITSIVIRNTTANAITGFAIGSSALATDVLAAVTIPANGTVVCMPGGASNPVLKPELAAAAAANLFSSASGWNSGAVQVTVKYVIAG